MPASHDTVAPLAPAARQSAASVQGPERDILHGLVAVLATRTDDIVNRVVEQMRLEIPAYTAITQADRQRALRDAVHSMVALFFATASERRRMTASEAASMAQLAADRSGTSMPLRTMLGGLRLAMRVGWQSGVDHARAMVGGAEATEALADLAAALFDFVDDLGAAFTERSLQEQEDRLTRRERVRQGLLEELVAGTYPSESEMAALAEAHGLDLRAKPLLLVVADDHADARWRIREATAALVRRLPGAVAASVQGTSTPHAVVMCPPSGTAGQAAARRMADAVAITHGVCIVVVAGVDGPSAVHRAYSRLAGELSLALSLHPSPSVVQSDELVIYTILRGDREEQMAFVHRTIGAVLRLPTNHGQPLLDTLTALQLDDGSVEAAATALHVHLQTVRYRLRRLTELTGLNVHRAPDRFRLCLAIHLWELHWVSPGNGRKDR